MTYYKYSTPSLAMGYSIPVFFDRSSARVVVIFQMNYPLFKLSPLAASLWCRQAISCCSNTDFCKSLFVFRFTNEKPKRGVFPTNCRIPPTVPTCKLPRFNLLFIYLINPNCAYKTLLRVKFDDDKSKIHYWQEHQGCVKQQLTSIPKEKIKQSRLGLIISKSIMKN